jgi:hypothetical protein
VNVGFTYLPGRPPADVAAEEMDDEPVEMTNLLEDETGVPGVIYISTQQGRHGPRVKWYPSKAGAGRPCLTITLEDPARIINHDVPAREASGVVAAAEWTSLNREALLRFWHHGTEFSRRELNAFADSLRKLP